MTRNIVATTALFAALASAGCHKKPPAKITAAPEAPAAATAAATPVADLNGEEARKGLPDVKMQTLATIYFDFDSSTLSAEAQAILKGDFDQLQQSAEVAVRLEGHSDERGSTQYNVALGDRRAQAVKTFLTSLGVPAARLTTASFGKEKPADAGHDPAAWAKNRRVELTIVADRVGAR